MSNSIDPDEKAHYEPSHLDLCCLQKPIIIACGDERVKQNNMNTLKLGHNIDYTGQPAYCHEPLIIVAAFLALLQLLS